MLIQEITKIYQKNFFFCFCRAKMSFFLSLNRFSENLMSAGKKKIEKNETWKIIIFNPNMSILFVANLFIIQIWCLICVCCRCSFFVLFPHLSTHHKDVWCLCAFIDMEIIVMFNENERYSRRMSFEVVMCGFCMLFSIPWMKIL